jgi:hypothetical protein
MPAFFLFFTEVWDSDIVMKVVFLGKFQIINNLLPYKIPINLGFYTDLL